MSQADELRKQLKDAKIYVIPYSHSDWAWTYTRQWHEERYTVVFNEVLDIMQTDPDYKWYFDTENEQLAPFREKHPERMDELRRRVHEGRVGIAGGTVTNPHPHRVSGETLIRNLVLGRRYFAREFPGVDLSALTLNDVIIGYSQLPQIIAKAGYKYYWTTRPGTALDQKGIPREFWWEGIDGSRLLCARGSYGGLASTDYLNEDWESAVVKLVGNEILPRMRWSQTKRVWLARGADDIRPLRTGNERPLDIIGLVRKWNQRENTPMRFATPLDYFRDLAELGDKIPVVKGIVDTVGWSYWYGQIGNESLRVWRVKSDEMLLTAEKLTAILPPNTALSDELNQLWWDMLTTCPHATLWLFEEDYQKMLRKAHRVYFDAQASVADSLLTLADKIDAKGAGEPIVAFNPLSWERTDNLVVHKSFPKRGTRRVQIATPEGKVVPHQLLSPETHGDGSLRESDLVFSADVPSLGYATFYLTEMGESDEAGYGIEPKELHALENDFLKLTFDAGRLLSLYDKETQMEHINADECSAGDLRFHVIEDTGPYHFGPVIDTLKMEVQQSQLLEAGLVRSRAHIQGNIGEHQVEQDIILHKNSRRVDFVTKIESAGGDGFFRVYFPIAYEGKIVGDVPFAVEERDVTSEPYGTLERHRENVFYASHWADYFTAEHGLALFIEGGQQGYYFDPEKRVLGHTLLKTIVHPQRGWERFETRLREGKGAQIFSYALYPHAGDWKDAKLYRQSLEYHSATRSLWKLRRLPDATLPEDHSFLTVKPENVVLSAFYQDGDALILRLYETGGTSAEAEVILPFAAKSVTSTNFLGEPSETESAIQIQRDVVKFQIKPWEIITLSIARDEQVSVFNP